MADEDDDVMVCFDLKCTLYMTSDGRRWVRLDMTAQEDDSWPDLHEVLGVLEMSKDEARKHYAEEEEEEEGD